MPSRYLLDLIKPVGHRFEQPAASREGAPILLQIGAGDLGNDAHFTDVDLWAKTHSQLPLGARPNVVMVEPNAGHTPSFWRNANRLPENVRPRHFLNAVIKGECKADKVAMYRFSDRVYTEFGLPYNIWATWLGDFPEFPLIVLRSFVDQGLRPTLAQQEEWHAFRRKADPSYVMQVWAPCLTPAGLLAEVNASASQLAMVVIDAEREDTNIVDRFLDMPTFRPAFLQFELAGSWYTGKQQPLIKRLRSMGFEVGKTRAEGEVFASDTENCVAVPASGK